MLPLRRLVAGNLKRWNHAVIGRSILALRCVILLSARQTCCARFASACCRMNTKWF